MSSGRHCGKFWAILLPALVVSACSSPTLVVLEDPRTYVEDRSILTAREDARIRLDINSLFVEQSVGDLTNIKVEVYERVVLLAGTVPTENARNSAGALAESVDGVMSVYNDLQVISDASLEDAAADLTIETRIKKALRAAEGIQSANMRWHSVNRVVYLFGRARSEHERQIAVGLVLGVEGVKEVVDRLRIMPIA